MTERRPYRRESEESRREALILAALELVAEGGLEAATVRSIAVPRRRGGGAAGPDPLSPRGKETPAPPPLHPFGGADDRR